MTRFARCVWRWLPLFLSATFALAQEPARGLNLALPTDNDALFHGGGAAFYQYITRDYQGAKSTPWEGGQYGFVRNPVETSGGLIYSRFHEGIDIKPMQRDASGEPTDAVRAIAEGTVVYVSLVPGYSNYGKYVVVEHRWDGCSYFSLYAHLASVAVEPGRKVARGTTLGVMGHTGEGLDQARAHVHLELNLFLSRHFESWYDTFTRNDPNHHGLYNGINLAGIDIARLFLALRDKPGLTIPDFLTGEEVFYKVRLPASKNFDLPQRYPWMLRGGAATAPAGWEVSFNRAGVPLKVEPSTTAVTAPVLSYVKSRRGDLASRTRNIVGGSGADAHLTENGNRLMRLLIWPE